MHLKGDLEVRGVTGSPSPPLNRRRPLGSSFRRRAPHARAILIATLSRSAPRTSAEPTRPSPGLGHALANRPGKVARCQTKGDADPCDASHIINCQIVSSSRNFIGYFQHRQVFDRKNKKSYFIFIAREKRSIHITHRCFDF